VGTPNKELTAEEDPCEQSRGRDGERCPAIKEPTDAIIRVTSTNIKVVLKP
jgi:hypothetical protein